MFCMLGKQQDCLRSHSSKRFSHNPTSSHYMIREWCMCLHALLSVQDRLPNVFHYTQVNGAWIYILCSLSTGQVEQVSKSLTIQARDHIYMVSTWCVSAQAATQVLLLLSVFNHIPAREDFHYMQVIAACHLHAFLSIQQNFSKSHSCAQPREDMLRGALQS